MKMLKAFFRFIYLPACDAVARAKQAITKAFADAKRERERVATERWILREQGAEALKIYRYRSMTPEQRDRLSPAQCAEFEHMAVRYLSTRPEPGASRQ
jgi:hypothetical protein